MRSLITWLLLFLKFLSLGDHCVQSWVRALNVNRILAPLPMLHTTCEYVDSSILKSERTPQMRCIINRFISEKATFLCTTICRLMYHQTQCRQCMYVAAIVLSQWRITLWVSRSTTIYVQTLLRTVCCRSWRQTLQFNATAWETHGKTRKVDETRMDLSGTRARITVVTVVAKSRRR